VISVRKLFNVHEVVNLIAIQAIQDGYNSYTQAWGLEVLRDACSEYNDQRFGTPIDTYSHFRVSFAAPNSTLQEGLDILNGLA